MTLQDLIASNTARQRRAQELNRRAGAVIFPVMNREELEAWLMPRLQGARRAAEIGDLASLILPPLDAEAEAAVLRDNPDTISLLGEEVKVEYWKDSAPRVVLTLDPVADRRWLDLPRELTLPNGRSVEISLRIPALWDPVVSTSGSEIVEKVRSHLNRDQWSRWTERPEIPVPDLTAQDAELPEITTAEYGRCVVTSEPLLAYGVAALSYYGYNTDLRGETRWVQSLAEAEQLHEAATAKLSKARAELRAKAREQEIRKNAESAREALRTLTSHGEYNNLPEETQKRAHALVWAALPYDLDQLEARAAETAALVAELEQALSRMAETSAAQEATDRRELAPILDAIGGVLSEARQIRDFAEACIQKASGNRDAAVRKLATELNARYGRERRQDGIRSGFPGIHATDAGERFFRFYRAEDVNAWLTGALAWLKAKSVPAIQPKKAAPPPPPAPKAEAKPTSGGLDLSGLGNKFKVRK